MRPRRGDAAVELLEQVAALAEAVRRRHRRRSVNSGMLEAARAGSQRNSHGSAARPRKPASWPGQTEPSVLKMCIGSAHGRRQAAASRRGPCRTMAPERRPVVRRPGVGVLDVHRLVRHARQHVVAAGRVGVVAGGHGPQRRRACRRAAPSCGNSDGDVDAGHVAWRSGRTRRGPRRGASGLGSQVECCGGPPIRKRTMQLFALPLPRRASRSRVHAEDREAKGRAERPPTRRTSRRDRPSQRRVAVGAIRESMRSPSRGEECEQQAGSLARV